ncbi:ABC transporter permease [Paenibacillus physcomitrellae]|uniref:ABC transporter permease n=1 Tax=Paenibacillus physcomitrellae TaxID=1619311 RepID=A0ABQ1G288_9BACL|nr:ABC transporter permease [Paenibacillus physcomitrellae]GGA35697.1 ABC transporter permease [Paenibacillus physcomitrellae]
MNLVELRRKRSGQFWGGILPYLGYVLQSGVAVLFLFCLIAFAAWYTAFIRNLPEGLPIRWIALVLLAPFAIGGGFRTFLQPADTVFLLPQEARMNRYFAPAWRGAVVRKYLILAVLIITFWPLYITAETQGKPFGWTALLLAGWSVVMSFGSWRELTFVSRPTAGVYRLLRWVVGVLAVAAWFWHPAGKALLFIIVLAAAYLASLYLPPRLRVPWELLIAAEKNHAARAMMVLGWFVEVPGREQRVHTRRWLSKWGSRIPWEPGQAYRYLLTKSFVRSDMFMIVLRVAVVGALLAYLSGQNWLGGAVYLFFVFVVGVQLSELRRVHSESFWLQLYPVPAGSRKANAVRLIFQIQLVYAVLMWLVFLPSFTEGKAAQAVYVLAGGLVITFLQRVYGKRTRKGEEEEE